MKTLSLASLALLALLAGSCSEPPRTITPPAPEPTTSASATAKPAPPLPAGAEKSPLPHSHPPIGDALKPLTFKAPAGWVSEQPTMMMRREQFRLPKQGADTSDAIVTVSVLAPGDGGPVEGNLQRWASQWKQPDGSDSRAALKQSQRLLGSDEVIEIDMSGTYTADERAMGGDKQYNEPDWRMLLSWIKSPTGNYYVKAVGPAATIAHWESSFRAYVSSAAP